MPEFTINIGKAFKIHRVIAYSYSAEGGHPQVAEAPRLQNRQNKSTRPQLQLRASHHG